jgi:hypothetical protein
LGAKSCTPKADSSHARRANFAGPPQDARQEDIFCAGGQAENLIKLHLACDRTSCTKATANAAGERI